MKILLLLFLNKHCVDLQWSVMCALLMQLEDTLVYTGMCAAEFVNAF